MKIRWEGKDKEELWKNGEHFFLAYGVNGKTLPKKHGFPLRVVAEGYYGSDWVKYVYKVSVDTV